MEVLRVLIVDDSLIIRAMLEQVVQKQPGYRVVGVASDVATAIGMIADLRPNVVTLDLAMPGANGLSLLDALKGTDHAPIVVVSSATHDDNPAAMQALAHGAAAYFDKAHLLSEADRFMRVLDKVVQRKARLAGTRGNASPLPRASVKAQT